jgi:type II secretory pathway pseudopilin PulG
MNPVELRSIGRPVAKGRQRAFTLVEILIVAALVVLLVTGLAAALRDNTGAALRTAQHLVTSLIAAARTSASANQTESRLIVYATPPPNGDPGKFLRMLQVFRTDSSGSRAWVPEGSPVYLPRGVCVVPPVTAGLLAPGVEWPANSSWASTLVDETPEGLIPSGAFEGASSILSVGFGPDGGTLSDSSSDVRLTVASVSGSRNRPVFNNPRTAITVVIRMSGAITLSGQPGDH